jgi:predicted DNA-binding protein
MTTTVRIPLRLEQALTHYCMETRRSKSEVIIELLEQRFVAESEQKTPYELAREAGFIASLSLDENAAAESRKRVRAAVARKHGVESV